jgi:hypothetical protein
MCEIHTSNLPMLKLLLVLKQVKHKPDFGMNLEKNKEIEIPPQFGLLGMITRASCTSCQATGVVWGLTASYGVLVHPAGSQGSLTGPQGPSVGFLMSCQQDVAACGTQGALTGPQESQKQAIGAPISQINLLSIPESFKNTNTQCTHKMEQRKRNQRKKQKEITLYN